MVSTTDRVASEIGADVIRRGGNAIDAAVATHFALAVVNPEAGNIGGGGFMIVHMADGTSTALDFREKAPLAATRDMYLASDGSITDRSLAGHLASGVPGSVAGMWSAHQRFGSLRWQDLIQPAITLAEGLVVHERLASSLREYQDRLRKFPTTAKTFLLDGRAPDVGERFVQHDLAGTLRRIAVDGRDGFYRERTAALIDAEMRRGGGLITLEDLGRYEAIWRDPVTFQYRGRTVVSMPPPSSGGATLAEILNILEGYDLTRIPYLSADHVQLWTEAVKRAYIDDIARLQPHLSRRALPELRLPNWKMSWLQCRAALRCDGRLNDTLDTLYSMGHELNELWESRAATRDQLLEHLQSWCERAETSAIAPLQRFARELRSYS